MPSHPLRSPLRASDPPSFDILKAWLDDTHLVSTDPRLRGVWDAGAGWHIVSDAEIPLGTRLVSIQKTSLFSLRTAPFSRLVSPPNESAAQAILHLASCLLFELRLGRESTWWPHWQILPRETVLLPFLWEDEGICGQDGLEALKWLEGTEAGRLLAAKRADGLGLDGITKYYHSVLPHFPPTDEHPDPPSLAHFLYAFTMVSTRGFLIDSYHIIALIPFADLFNHSSSTPHTSVATDADVCPSCGAFGACEHGRHEVSLRSAEALERDAKAGKVVDMFAERSIGGKEDVWSCYEHGLGGAKMLVEWGFVPPLPDTHDGDQPDTLGVSWGPRDVLDRGTVRWFADLTAGNELWEALEAARADEEAAGRTGQRSLLISQSTEEGRGLNLTADGQVSINLVIAAVLQALHTSNQLEQMQDIEAVGQVVLDTCLQLEGGPKVVSSLAQEVARRLSELAQTRQEQMAVPSWSVQDLEQHLGALDVTHPLEHMALHIVLHERKSLEAAQGMLEGVYQRP